MLLDPRKADLGVEGFSWPSSRAADRGAAPRPQRRAVGSTRPAHPADMAQARLFETILLRELTELEELVATAETHWLRRCERGADRHDQPPEVLVRFRGLVAEAQRLVDGLRERFLFD
jgi:hypothetical protein